MKYSFGECVVTNPAGCVTSNLPSLRCPAGRPSNKPNPYPYSFIINILKLWQYENLSASDINTRRFQKLKWKLAGHR